MPLSINVGLSRKASRDYQSSGVSINVTAELDQSLLARPDELQRQVADLYEQAQSAMQRQAQNMSVPVVSPDGDRERNDHPRRHTDGRSANGNGGNNGDRGNAAMTASQRRAIESIARQLDVDADYEAREIVGAEFNRLTLRQASELIDHLKAMQPTGDGNRR